MNNNSRTKNASKNALIGLITQILKIIIEFIIRTIFIKMLGSEYLGINGLFTNILTILSFAELGIGNAIIFNMYKEVKNDNIEKIKSLMNLYKKAYLTIGIIVLTLGGCITPFIEYFINSTPNIKESIHIIYLLFLLNSALSYLFAYKKAIISAYQKEYIINICKLIAEIIKAIFQIAVLVFTKNFILYLIIQILCTMLDNIMATYKANKMFPFLKEKNIIPLEKQEKNKIFTNVKSLVMYKFGSIILNGTDNILVSKLLGLSTVGLLSNYNLIVSTINTLFGSVLNGFTASVGNLNADNDTKKQENVLNQLLLMCVWIYGFCAISFVTLANSFIEIWVGDAYKLSFFAVIAIGLHLYVNGVQFAGYTYRTTMGLFEKGKFCPIIAAIVNILLSIVLCKYMGLAGIILATSVSRLVTTTWYDIFMVYKFKFNKNPINFYLKYISYFALTCIIFVIVNYLCSLVNLPLIIEFIVKIVICCIAINLAYLICFFHKEEFKEILERVKRLLWKKRSAI